MAEKSSELELNENNEETMAIAQVETADEKEARLQETADDIELIEGAEDAPDEAYQIREQIVETRRGMGETIDAIQEKLSFSNISEQVQTQVSEQINNVVETAKDAFYEKTADVVNSVGRGLKDIGAADLVKKAQQNPTALAIIGAGIGALVVGLLAGGGGKKKRKKSGSKRHKNASYEYEYAYQSDSDEIRYADTARRDLKSGEPTGARESSESTFQKARNKAGDTANAAVEGVTGATGAAFAGIAGAAGSAYENVGSAAGKTYESLGSAAGKTYEGIGNVAGKTYDGISTAAGYTYEKAGDLGGQMKVNYDHYIEENPLAVGAVALAIGAAIGFAIPLTRKENEYLGEYRDQVVEKATATAQDAIGTVKQMATEAQKVITEEVKSKTA